MPVIHPRPGSSGVEQWTENPRVGGSNPPPGTIFQVNINDLIFRDKRYACVFQKHTKHTLFCVFVGLDYGLNHCVLTLLGEQSLFSVSDLRDANSSHYSSGRPSYEYCFFDKSPAHR